MRLRPSAFLLSLAAVAACSADRVDAPHSQPQIPRVSASEIVLGGLTVFRSEASGINDGGTVVGNAQLTVFDREQAAVWMPSDYHLTFLPDAGAGSSSASRHLTPTARSPTPNEADVPGADSIGAETLSCARSVRPILKTVGDIAPFTALEYRSCSKPLSISSQPGATVPACVATVGRSG